MRDVIPDPFIKKISIPRAVPSYTGKKEKVVRAIFLDFLKIMIDDLIENNNKFLSPSRNGFLIYIREKSRAEQRRLMSKTTIYQDVDLISSNGRFYEFVLISKHLTGSKYRKIRIGYKKYKNIIKNVNNGMRYHER